MIYEATISYAIIDKNGNDKTVKESYIFENTDTFSEVETMAYETFGTLSAIDVIAIKRSRLQEIINSRETETQSVFTVDVADTQVNESGEEVELVYKVVLFAENIDDAYAKAKEYLKQGYGMYLVAIKKTRFKDVVA